MEARTHYEPYTVTIDKHTVTDPEICQSFTEWIQMLVRKYLTKKEAAAIANPDPLALRYEHPVENRIAKAIARDVLSGNYVLLRRPAERPHSIVYKNNGDS